MVQSLYELERILELEQCSREAQRRYDRGEHGRRDRGARPSAWLATVASVLALFRLG